MGSAPVGGLCALLIAILVIILAAAYAAASSLKMGGGVEDAEELSPPLCVRETRGVQVVRDDLLPYGTKQRAARAYLVHLLLHEPLATTLLYTGAANGYGPLAAPVMAALSPRRAAGGALRAHLVYSLELVGGARVGARAARALPPVQQALQLGARVEFSGAWGELVARGKALAASDACYWLPLGLDDPAYERGLAAALAEAAAQTPGFSPAVLWVAGGTGVIARSLGRAFPRATVKVFAAGAASKLRVDGVANVRVVASAAPRAAAEAMAPYPTVPGYDARTWDVYIKNPHGAEAEAVWNTAGGPPRAPRAFAPEPVPALFVRELQRVMRWRTIAQHIHRALERYPLKGRKRFSQWIPDVMARWVFALHAVGKQGDPLLPTPAECSYAPAMARHAHLYVTAPLPALEAALAGLPAAVAAAAAEEWDVTQSATLRGVVPPTVRAPLARRLAALPDDATAEARHAAVYARYAAMGGLGHQMHAPASARAFLARTFCEAGARPVELYASAVNADPEAPHFFSMFPDLEEPYGSLGPFTASFRARSASQVFVGHPPYDETQLTEFARIVCAELESAGSPLTFLIGWPEWEDFPPTAALEASPFLRLRVRFGAREAAWVNDYTGELAGIPAHLWYCLSTRQLAEFPGAPDPATFAAAFKASWPNYR